MMRKQYQNGLSLLLCLVLLFISLPSGIFAVEGDGGGADGSGGGEISGLVEDVSLRAEFSKVYRDDTGKLYAVVYPEQQHYLEDGAFVEVDNRLTLNDAGDRYASLNTRFPVSFSKNSAGDSLVQIEDGDYSLSWAVAFVGGNGSNGGTGGNHLQEGDVALPRIDGVNAVLAAEEPVENEVLGDLSALSSGAASISGVRYNSVFDGKVDLRYALTHGKVEEDIILNAPSDFTGYLLTVNTGGLTAQKTADGAVAFKTEAGEVIFTLVAPWMSDEAGEISSEIDVQVAQKGNTAYIGYTPDANWLNDPERAYPVLIDPSFTTRYYQQNYVDTYVYPGCGDAFSRATATSLKIGTINGVDHRAYMNILNIPDIGDNYCPSAASLQFYITNKGTNQPVLTVSAVTESWSTETIGFDDVSSSEIADDVTPSSATSGKYLVDLLPLFEEQYRNNIPFSEYIENGWHGLEFKYTTPTTGEYGLMVSSENISSAQRPVLIITYDYFLYDILMDGGVYSFVNAESNKYLTTNPSSTADGSNVYQTIGAGTRAQAFRLDVTAGNALRIRSMNSNDGEGSLIEFAYTASATDTNYVATNAYLRSYTTGRENNNEWLIYHVEGNLYKIVSRADPNLALTAVDSSVGMAGGTGTTAAGNVIVSEYTGSNYQHWNIESAGMILDQSMYNLREPESIPSELHNIRERTACAYKFCCIATEFGYTASPFVSSNELCVSVEENGVIKAHEVGQATISITLTKEGMEDQEYSYTFYSYIQSGKYYIRNLQYDKYLQIDDSTAPAFNTSGAHMEQWELTENPEQQWEITYLGEGYYKIISRISGMALSVPSSQISSENATLIQENYIGATRQQWSIQTTESGICKIKARSSENLSKDLAMVVNSNASTAPNGTEIKQREYSSDTQYGGEWVLDADIVTLSFYYDHAFSERYDQAASLITDFIPHIQRIFQQAIHVRIKANTPQSFYSIADKCKDERGIDLTSTETSCLCPATNNGYCAIHDANCTKTNCTGSDNCTSWTKIFYDFMAQHPGNENNVPILFTGNKLFKNNSFHMMSYHGVIIQTIEIDPKDYVGPALSSTVHELAHEFAAPDHYHIVENGECKNWLYCNNCRGESGRPKWCLMDSSKNDQCEWPTDLGIRNVEEIFCEECLYDMCFYTTN